jgi:tetratricopeptide (TPR) repeat protein
MFSLQQPNQQADFHDRSGTQAALALMSIGNEFLDHGELSEAMATYDAAHSVLTSPSTGQTWATAAKRLQLGSRLLQSDSVKASSRLKETPPDLYEEDECDVGPRILRTPITADSRSVRDITLLEAIVLYNKGLVYHSMGNLSEAKQLYEIVVYTVQNMLTFAMGNPSTTYMQLAMRCHNNLGLVSYLERKEGVAAASFEAAAQFAKYLVPLSQAYRLEYATALSNWCRVNWMRGDVSDNLYKSLKEVLRVRTGVLSWHHPDVAAAHYNVAVAEYARDDSSKAVSHLTQYLAVTKHRCKVKNDLDAVPALIFLLLIQNEDKDDHTSQDLVRGLRTLQDKRQDLGPNSLEVASVLNYVGTLLFHQHDFESALVFFTEELRLEDHNKNVLQDDSELDETTSVSVTCNNIGRILQELGRLHEAISYYHRALEPEYGDDRKRQTASCKLASTGISTKNGCVVPSFPSSSVNLYSTVWYNLGLIHDKLGSYGEAINAFEMSLNLRKVLLGCNHSDIACLLYNIGVLQMEQQRLDDASVSFREALHIRRVATAGQLNDRHIVKTLEKLASLHKDRGNIIGALEVAQEILTIQEVSAEYDSATRMKEMGATLRSVAELHHAAGTLDAAVHWSMDSVNKLRIASDLSTQQHMRNMDMELEPLLVLEHIANVEQLISSLLLLGSLYHEICEPLQAEKTLREAATIVQQTAIDSNRYPSSVTPPSLLALQEVTMMLGTCQCAPMA